MSPQFINLAVFFISSFALLPLVNFSELSGLSTLNIAICFFLGANTFLAYGSLAEALKRAPASKVSLIIALNPLLTILILQVFDALNISPIPPEKITLAGVVAVMFVVAGVIMVVLKPKKA